MLIKSNSFRSYTTNLMKITPILLVCSLLLLLAAAETESFSRRLQGSTSALKTTLCARFEGRNLIDNDAASERDRYFSDMKVYWKSSGYILFYSATKFYRIFSTVMIRALLRLIKSSLWWCQLFFSWVLSLWV